MKKYVYWFGNGTADGDATMRDTLGGKGSGLAEMSRNKLPVPPGFTISTEVCNIYFQNGNTVPAEADRQTLEALKVLEERTGQKLGDAKNPLLVSVRSGARTSMPGMMDTILNVGLNDETVTALVSNSDSPRFAYDRYREFIEMYGEVVLGISKRDFEAIFEAQKNKAGVNLDTELSTENLMQVIAAHKNLVQERTGKPFPQSTMAQLEGARDAVFRSWFSERAIGYRKMRQIPDDLGTAVNVQQMALSDKSGVMFTVDPVHKRRDHMMIEAIFGLGEGIVSGMVTPDSYIVNRADGSVVQEFVAVKSSALVYDAAAGHTVEKTLSEEDGAERVLSNRELDDLRLVGLRLEELFGKPQDIEWCIGGDRLSLLQSRPIRTL